MTFTKSELEQMIEFNLVKIHNIADMDEKLRLGERIRELGIEYKKLTGDWYRRSAKYSIQDDKKD